MQVTGLGTQLGVVNQTAKGAAAAVGAVTGQVTTLGSQIGVVNQTATVGIAALNTQVAQVRSRVLCVSVRVFPASYLPV